MQSENVGCEFNKILISIQRCKPFGRGGKGIEYVELLLIEVWSLLSILICSDSLHWCSVTCVSVI